MNQTVVQPGTATAAEHRGHNPNNITLDQSGILQNYYQ